MIEDIAVIGIPDDVWGEAGRAFVVLKPGASLEAEEVIAFCDGRLARYKWPRIVTFCDHLPRTSLDKIRKGLLLQGARE